MENRQRCDRCQCQNIVEKSSRSCDIEFSDVSVFPLFFTMIVPALLQAAGLLNECLRGSIIALAKRNSIAFFTKVYQNRKDGQFLTKFNFNGRVE